MAAQVKANRIDSFREESQGHRIRGSVSVSISGTIAAMRMAYSLRGQTSALWHTTAMKLSTTSRHRDGLRVPPPICRASRSFRLRRTASRLGSTKWSKVPVGHLRVGAGILFGLIRQWPQMLALLFVARSNRQAESFLQTETLPNQGAKVSATSRSPASPPDPRLPAACTSAPDLP